MEKEQKAPESSFEFWAGEDKPVMRLSEGKFWWKGEEVKDVNNIYKRFCQWMDKAEKINKL